MAVVSDRSAACVCCLPIVLSVRVLGTAWLCALHMAVRDPLRPPSGGHCPSGMQHDVGAHGDGSRSEFSSVMPLTFRLLALACVQACRCALWPVPLCRCGRLGGRISNVELMSGAWGAQCAAY